MGPKSIVMLIFLLFSDKVLGGGQKSLRGELFRGGGGEAVEESRRLT